VRVYSLEVGKLARAKLTKPTALKQRSSGDAAQEYLADLSPMN
jgi:hypothetical protein